MEYSEDDPEKVQDSQQRLLELKNRGLIVVAMALKDAVTNKNNCSLPNQIKGDYSPDKRREQFNTLCKVLFIEQDAAIIQACWSEIDKAPRAWIKNETCRFKTLESIVYTINSNNNTIYSMGIIFGKSNKANLLANMLEDPSFKTTLAE